jgi:hypothetical protein
MWTREHDCYLQGQPSLGDPGSQDGTGGGQLRRHGRSGRLGWIEARRGEEPTRSIGYDPVRPVTRRG